MVATWVNYSISYYAVHAMSAKSYLFIVWNTVFAFWLWSKVWMCCKNLLIKGHQEQKEP